MSVQFTAAERAGIARAGEAVLPLPLPGCADLASALDCVAHTPQPNPAQVAAATALGDRVRAALLAEANPDRWLSEFTPDEIDWDMIQALISEREYQALLVGDAVAALRRVAVAVPA